VYTHSYDDWVNRSASLPSVCVCVRTRDGIKSKRRIPFQRLRRAGARARNYTRKFAGARSRRACVCVYIYTVRGCVNTSLMQTLLAARWRVRRGKAEMKK